jgi:hypothetical protein
MIPYYGVRLDGSEPTGNGQIADGFVTVLLAKYKDDKYYSFVLAIDHDKVSCCTSYLVFFRIRQTCKNWRC